MAAQSFLLLSLQYTQNKSKKKANSPTFTLPKGSVQETLPYILSASIQGAIFALLIIAIYHD